MSQAILTVPPHDNPYHLYIGNDKGNYTEGEHIAVVEIERPFDKGLSDYDRALLQSVLLRNGYNTTSPWTDEIEWLVADITKATP